MIQSVIGFIGAGNMAEALIRGLLETKSCDPANIYLSDINDIRLAYLAKEYSVRRAENNIELQKLCQVIILAVKPQQITEVLAELQTHWDFQKQVVISIAAGIPSSFIEKKASGHLKVIRVMPNMLAKYRAGAAAFCLGQYAGETEAMLTRRLFESVGIVTRVEEKDMNAVTALSGSGPAYIFKICELLTMGGIEMGLDPTVAGQLALQTIWGAGLMLKESGESAEKLRIAVTSPGGTTQAALNSMEQTNFDRIFIQAMLAARDRGQALQPKNQEEK